MFGLNLSIVEIAFIVFYVVGFFVVAIRVATSTKRFDKEVLIYFGGMLFGMIWLGIATYQKIVGG